MSPQTKNILITSSVLSIIMTVIVIWNTPTDKNHNKKNSFFKVLVLSFIACSFVLYVMLDNDSNAMMTNIIQGDPDF